MHKFFKVVVITVLAVLSLQHVTFASEKVNHPPKPTEGIESTDPKHGDSTDNSTQSIQSIDGLFYNYYCSITNTGTDLYLEGSTVANYVSDQVSITLYLQKWNGSTWVDVQNWSLSKYNVRSITNGETTSYQRGNYYRTRAVHYVKYGSQTGTQNSTSSYIYID